MTPANITALQALVQADPALTQQLQSAATNEAATQLLAKAASQKRLAVDAHAIADYLKTSQTTEISDAELEAVAGGTTPGDTYTSGRTSTRSQGGQHECVGDRDGFFRPGNPPSRSPSEHFPRPGNGI